MVSEFHCASGLTGTSSLFVKLIASIPTIMLRKSLHSLYQYIKQEEYRGWDIFDGLNSRVFKRSPFYRSRILRLVWIQFFKRFPVNFRKIALVPKGYNAKGLGLFASGLVALGKMDEAKRLLDMLEGMACSNHAGASWGYNFDWQARAFFGRSCGTSINK